MNVRGLTGTFDDRVAVWPSGDQKIAVHACAERDTSLKGRRGAECKCLTQIENSGIPYPFASDWDRELTDELISRGREYPAV